MEDQSKPPEAIEIKDRGDLLMARRVSRRSMLKWAGTIALTYGSIPAFLEACASGGTTGSTGGGMNPADSLTMQVYTINVQLMKDVIDKYYKKQYSGKSVDVITVPADYYSTTEARLLSGKPPMDALEMDPGFMAKYYGNKWVPDLEGLPGVNDLKADMYPSSLATCTSPDGKLAALPDVVNIIPMFYNAEILNKYGMKPADQWDDLLDQAVTLKSKGIESPVVPVWTTKFSLTKHLFVTDCISRGFNSQFDDNLNPLWDTNPVGLEVLNFWRKLQDAKVLPPDVLSIDHHQASSIMQSGRAAYFWFNGYELANLNKAGTSAAAGKIRVSVLPGKTHGCGTFTSVVYQTKKNDRDKAWPLTSFRAGYDKEGKLTGVIQITAIGDAGFTAYKSLANNQEIADAWKAWANSDDLAAFSRQLAGGVLEGKVQNQKWFGDYEDYMAKTLSRFLARQISAEQALKDTADHTRKLKAS
jgi:ABC-type glycerol-3-phosphate transport system substrate-binding protein